MNQPHPAEPADPGPASSAGTNTDALQDAAFRRHAYTAMLPILRIALVSGAPVFVASYYWDVATDPIGAASTLKVRLVAGFLFWILFGLTFVGPIRERPNQVYVASTVVISVALAFVYALLDGGIQRLYGLSLIGILVIASLGPTARVAVPLMMIMGASPDVVQILARFWGAPALHSAPVQSMLEINFVWMAAFVVGIVLVIAAEKQARSLFHLTQQFERAAGTDPLTGAPNLRRFQEVLMQETSRQRRFDGRLALVALDLDHFKRVNDTYGHDVGNEVLREMVRRWRGTLRSIDTLARVGGEEFVAVLPETPLESAVIAAERLCARTRQDPVLTKAGALAVTVSAGVAEVGQREDPYAALKRADQALYAAKSAGRNRVSVHPASGVTTSA